MNPTLQIPYPAPSVMARKFHIETKTTQLLLPSYPIPIIVNQHTYSNTINDVSSGYGILKHFRINEIVAYRATDQVENPVVRSTMQRELPVFSHIDGMLSEREVRDLVEGALSLGLGRWRSWGW